MASIYRVHVHVYISQRHFTKNQKEWRLFLYSEPGYFLLSFRPGYFFTLFRARFFFSCKTRDRIFFLENNLGPPEYQMVGPKT